MNSNKTIRQHQLERRIAKFVERLLAGDREHEAYLVSHKKAKRLADDQLKGSARQFANRPDVKAAYRLALRSIPVENILNPGEHAATLKFRAQKAFDEGNYTASSAYDRIIATANGMARDTQVTLNTWKIADAELLRQMAGDDPLKQQAVRTLLGSDSFDNQPKSDESGGNGHQIGTNAALKH